MTDTIPARTPHPVRSNAVDGPLEASDWPTPGDVVIYRPPADTGPRVPALVRSVGHTTGLLTLQLPHAAIAADVAHGTGPDRWILYREAVWATAE